MWPSKSEDFQNHIVTLFWNWHLIILWAQIKTVVHLDINFSKKCVFLFVLKCSNIYADAFVRKGSKRLDKECGIKK